MIYLIITACIHNTHGFRDKKSRMQTYVHHIRASLSHLPPEIQPIIVENSAKNAPTYLDGISRAPVVYTQNNLDATKTQHKGITELADIHAIMSQFHIADDDIVIKLTGRYCVQSPDFFEFVLHNQHKYDAFVKFYNVCTHQFMYDDCVLGMYALKAKQLREFRYSTETENVPSMEVQFARYVRSTCSPERVCEIPVMNIVCIFANDMRVQYV